MNKLAPIPELRVFYHRGPAEDDRLLVGRLAYRLNHAVFEYDADFRALELELSPFKLPLAEGLLAARPELFEGLFGLFDDSLPDGWGRLLLDRYVERIGGRVEKLTPLDRLAWVGSRAIGALSYEPAQDLEHAELLDLHVLGEQALIVLEDRTSDALETLLTLGGSPQGARPKALVLISEDGDRIVSGTEHREGFSPYLVKFSATADPRNAAGAIEYAYSRMALAAGVSMPETRLLASTGEHCGYFAIRRFDRRGHQRLHTHTISGLLDAPPGYTAITYEDVLKATRLLTRDEREVRQMFRRAAFNVYAHNRDDHSRNFAFLMEPDGTWTLAPAYDLTFSPGPGGEHTMLLGGEGRNLTRENLLALAKAASIKQKAAREIVEQVREVCSKWHVYAEEARVPEKDSERVRAALDLVQRMSP